MVKLFKKVCAGCNVRGGLVITKGAKSLNFSDLEQRGIADLDSIEKLLMMEFDLRKATKIN